jgi:pimeloyl-ACP methyl ester carboxylesterase
MSETTVASGDAQICTEAFGDPADPAVLLIMGQMASMLWWPVPLCERLAAAGRYAIRYDHRDTGHSTHYPPGEPDYTVEDMVGDALAVLDGHEVERAHVVGMSMGGALAQLLALGHPERVASVTAISTTPVGDQDADLPGPSPAYLERAPAFDGVDWTNRETLAELLVADARALAGSAHPFDEDATRDFVRRDLARSDSTASLQNHPLVRSAGGALPPLAELAPPLLVIHGAADPLFPPAHGEALAAAVPGARLVAIDGGGHELHEADWPAIVDAVVRHTALA